LLTGGPEHPQATKPFQVPTTLVAVDMVVSPSFNYSPVSVSDWSRLFQGPEFRLGIEVDWERKR
jgi:hypothetical protein